MDTTRFIPNPYEDYSGDSKFLRDGQLHADLIRKINDTKTRLNAKLEDYLASLNPSANYGIYIGYCGIAYLYLLKHSKSKQKTDIERASALVRNAVEHLKNKGISFLEGDAGPLALSVLINSVGNPDIESTDAFRRLLTLPDNLDSAPSCELLYGRVGYLYSLLFVEKFVKPDLIPDDIYKKNIQKILEIGAKNARISKYQAPLKYEWYETNYFGAAHGLAGILYILLCLNKYLTEADKNTLIQPSLDWLLGQRFPSGNFISSEGSKRDQLVQWCHGAPGFVYVYTLANKIFGVRRYMDLALQCGDVVWERGILSKGYSICHGVSGNAYSFLELYKVTKDMKHLHRAACFADWCTYHPRDEGMKPDRPYSLFEGMAGVNYFLTDFVEPLNAAFPGFSLT